MFTRSCLIIPATTRIEAGINGQKIRVAMMPDKQNANVSEHDQDKTTGTDKSY
jgi:hypothetical protein